MSEDDLKILADITRPVLRPIPRDPDRVIDAPIPEDLKNLYTRVKLKRWQCLAIDEEIGITPDDLAGLIERIARLEAEKQDAWTEGWNACVVEAAKVASRQRYNGDYYSARTDAYDRGVRSAASAIEQLAKPTAAKQGDAS